MNVRSSILLLIMRSFDKLIDVFVLLRCCCSCCCCCCCCCCDGAQLIFTLKVNNSSSNVNNSSNNNNDIEEFFSRHFLSIFLKVRKFWLWFKNCGMKIFTIFHWIRFFSTFPPVGSEAQWLSLFLPNPASLVWLPAFPNFFPWMLQRLIDITAC